MPGCGCQWALDHQQGRADILPDKPCPYQHRPVLVRLLEGRHNDVSITRSWLHRGPSNGFPATA